MTESVKYYEATVNVSGTTRLGVYARSDEEAEKLLNEHLYYFGVDNFSSNLDLDVCEVVSIENPDKRYASELVNDDEKIQPFFDGIYYCPWTGLDHCVSDGRCKDFADCPVREQEGNNG